MKRALAFTLLSALFSVGCGSDSPQPSPENGREPAQLPVASPEADTSLPEPVDADPYATTGRRAAEGLNDAERASLGSALSGTQEVRQVVTWTERSNTRAAQAWRELTHEERVNYLRLQASQGSGRAARALKAVLAGSVTEEQLAEMGDVFVVSPFTRPSAGVELMPFGDSMFGPWDVGPQLKPE